MSKQFDSMNYFLSDVKEAADKYCMCDHEYGTTCVFHHIAGLAQTIIDGKDKD